MTYVSFDPRVAFREGLGVTYDIDDNGDLESCITITDNTGATIPIPIYLTEEVKSEALPHMPFIEMQIPPGGTVYQPQDIKAATRKMMSYIKLHIYFTDMDNLDRTKFAKKIKDKLHDLVRTNQSITANIDFMNIEDDGLEEESDGHQFLFHYVATLYCLYYDFC